MMGKVIFTICSNNYLAQAKTLGDSVSMHNPDYKFVIVLCDKKNESIDYSFFKNMEIIEAHNLNIEKFDEMSAKYNIIELNTSIKPFVFNYLYENFVDAETIMYFDPDTCVFNKLSLLEEELENFSILLTPHICTPIDFDGYHPTENTFTQYGIYNLGFLATKRSVSTQKMLDWWMKRLEKNCFTKESEGIFVDQLPMNFAPIFFDNVKVSQNLGLNAAPWNLHERKVSLKNNMYFINDEIPLLFYHFSNCQPNNNENLSVYYNRVTFESNDALKKAYDDYKMAVLNNKYNQYTGVQCFYGQKPLILKKESLLQKMPKYLKKLRSFLAKNAKTHS